MSIIAAAMTVPSGMNIWLHCFDGRQVEDRGEANHGWQARHILWPERRTKQSGRPVLDRTGVNAVDSAHHARTQKRKTATMATQSSKTFVESARQEDTSPISRDELAWLLGLQVQALADHAGVLRNTVRANPEAAPIQDFAGNVIRAVKAGLEVIPDPQKVAYLLKNDLLGTFGDKTGLELIEAGRTDDLVGYLKSVAAGFAG